MLKAQHAQTGEDVLILIPRWKGDIPALRQLDRLDLLICPGCRQPVRVKAGEIKRWHFAHKHLANCPFEKQSPLLLATRAVLYAWLATQFGEERVILEKMVDGLPRPLDVYVSGEPGIAYWIFDTRMPPDERDRLSEQLSRLHARRIWLFAMPILNVKTESPAQIILTTTEREFRRQTESDAAQPAGPFMAGETLHYLDADTSTLITYRNLNVRHAPQVFAGRRIESPLADVRVDAETGDLLHPGEAERIAQHRQTLQQRDEKMRQTLPKLGARFESMVPSGGRSDLSKLFSATSGEKPAAGPIPVVQKPRTSDVFRAPFARVGTCKHCGKQTDDWVSFDGRTAKCVCRECGSEGKR